MKQYIRSLEVQQFFFIRKCCSVRSSCLFL